MKKTLLGVLSLAAVLALAPMIASANDGVIDGVPTIAAGEHEGGMMGGDHDGRRQMTPEEREERHAKMKAKFDSLPPEKQAEIKARMEERHEKMKNMTPEQREEFKEKRREERREHHGRDHEGRGRGGLVTHGATQAPVTAQ